MPKSLDIFEVRWSKEGHEVMGSCKCQR